MFNLFAMFSPLKSKSKTATKTIVSKFTKAARKPLVKKATIIKSWIKPDSIYHIPAPKPIVVKKQVPAVIPPAPVIKPLPSHILIPVIYPYDRTSEAARLLARELKTKRVFENGSYVYQPNNLVINYGNKRQPNWGYNRNVKILNHWNVIQLSSNKLTALNRLKERKVSTIEFTTSKDKAVEWVRSGQTVMCRTILNGHSGHGIVVAIAPEQVVDAPLYSVYKKNIGEFRLIIVNGVVVDFMQKKRKIDWKGENGEKVNPLVKNHCNGWIFARQDVHPPKIVLDEAVKAMEALELNFAAVDVIYNQKENKAYILECNTAIGLEADGTTLKNLSTAFLAICNNQKPKSVI